MTTTWPGTARVLKLNWLKLKPKTPSLARMAGKDSPVNRQPSAMRLPAPRPVQLVPSVEVSKVVRQTSGVVPARSHVTVWPSEERY